MEARTTFLLTKWFEYITEEDMEEATRNGDGIVVMSETSNPDIFDTMAEEIK